MFPIFVPVCQQHGCHSGTFREQATGEGIWSTIMDSPLPSSTGGSLDLIREEPKLRSLELQASQGKT